MHNIADMSPFKKVILFSLKARRTGYWVPDEYRVEFVAHTPDKLIGFVGCDPTQPGNLKELERVIEHLGLHSVKMGPIYTDVFPLYYHPWQFLTTLIAAQVNNRLLLFGNLNPFDDIERKSYEALAEVMAKQIAIGQRYGRFVISTGSPLTPNTTLPRIHKYIELGHTLSAY